jgi:hypothetical protein
MKNKIIVFLCVIALLVIGFLLLPRGANSIPSAQPPDTNAPTVTRNAIPTNVVRQINTNVGVAAASTGQVLSATGSVAEEKKEKMRAMLDAQNVPFDFYGQVIDQGSNSLPSVKIKLTARHWSIDPSLGAIHIVKETDAAGRFHINGVTGDAFDIESVEKSGYDLEPHSRHSYSAVGGSFEKPIIFKMWSTNIQEQLVTGEKRFHIVPDGRTYVIDLSKGTIAESGEGDLKVWIKYQAAVTGSQLYDWSSEIDVINGGLLQETDAYSSMYSAPMEGYTPTFLYPQQPVQIKAGQRGRTGQHRFYIMLKNGQEYGRITIDLVAPYNDQIPGLIEIQYAINPSGSRILR